jgi:prepilin-type N-terminal cleavage/methylation domain-containing protein
MRMTNAGSRRGMSAIETLVVLAMIGVLTAIAFPKIVTIRQQMELSSSADQVLRELNLVQMRAVKESRAISFYRLNSRDYRIGDTEMRQLPSGVSFGAGTPAEIRFASFGPLITGPAAVELEAVQINKKKRVVLNASGFAKVQ